MSEQYKALTRKYRPVTFDDIVSQEHVSSTLKNAIEGNRLSHAYLFCGPRGVGKTTMARVLARTINEVGAEVDGEALNQTLNIIEVDAASNNKVEDAHRIRESVRIPPQTGKYKIFIIDEVHMLTKQAFNALLKTLEEPPAHAIFIFATTEPHKVLPTILSRVQRFDFKPISVSEIVDRLKKVCKEEDITIDEESLHIIARKAEGALRDALGLLDQVIAFCGLDITYAELQKTLNVVSTDRLFDLTGHIHQSDTTAGIRLVNDVLMEGYDIQEFLIALTEHFRNLMLAKDDRNHFAIESSEEVKKRLVEASAWFSEEDLLRMLHMVHDAQFKIRDAHQPKILLEITILKLIRMEKSEGLKELLHEIALLKKKFINQANVASNTTETGAEKPKSEIQQKPSSPVTSGNNTSSPATKSASTPVQAVSAHGNEVLGKPSIAGLRPRNGLRSVPINRKDQQSNETGKADVINGNLALSARNEEETNVDSSSENTEKKGVYLHEVSTIWEKYVDGLKEPLPSFVRITMQSTKPIDVKSKELLLQCNDSLAARLIEEHRDVLSDKLQGFVGQKMRIRCVVRQEKKQTEQNDPYSRFKELQDKDPRIKTIVDLFGAELEYSY